MKLQNIRKPIILFSVDREDRPVNDTNQHWRQWARKVMEVQGITYIEVLGNYNGIKELSFMVDAVHSNMVEIIAISAEQDMYLHLDEYRNATGVHPRTRVRTDLGKFVTSRHRPCGDWTYRNGNYYEVV